MTGFEFSLIPVAIIVGFALTRILSRWGQVVRQWSSLQIPWLFLSFTVIAMAGMLSHFVGDWAYRERSLRPQRRLRPAARDSCPSSLGENPVDVLGKRAVILGCSCHRQPVAEGLMGCEGLDHHLV